MIEEQIIRADPQLLLLANTRIRATANAILNKLKEEFPRLAMHHIPLVPSTDRPRADWLSNALRFHLSQGYHLPRRAPVPAETYACHLDPELPPSASQSLIDYRLTKENRAKRIQEERQKFLGLLTMAEANHYEAQAYLNLAQSSRVQLNLRCARGILEKRPHALASARLDLCRSLSVLAHYVQGVELAYLPSPVDPSGRRFYVHHTLTPAMRYALHAAMYPMDPWLRQSLLDAITQVWPDQLSMEEAFCLNTQFSGMASFMHSVLSVHMRLMNDWLGREQSDDHRPISARELDLFAHFWDLPSMREDPKSFCRIHKEFHNGARYTSPLTFPPFGYFIERVKKRGLPASPRK
jgi:hypothetical protein